jgi:hypothetical protein
MVSQWRFNQTQQMAYGYTCRRCLFEIQGRDQVNAMQAKIDERHAQEAARAVSQVEGSKINKSPDRQKQKAQG